MENKDSLYAVFEREKQGGGRWPEGLTESVSACGR